MVCYFIPETGDHRPLSDV